MVARKAGGLTALACLAAWGCTRLAEDALPPGSRFPLAGAAAGTQVVWVMRPDDYLTCQTAASGVRELQRRVGHRVPLTVLYVGPHPAWLAEFLAPGSGSRPRSSRSRRTASAGRSAGSRGRGCTC